MQRTPADQITTASWCPSTEASDAPSPMNYGVLVMGLTGAGKSTFISALTEKSVDIGHSLDSCTTDVELFEYDRSDGGRTVLIDTPGFDDSTKDNARVLEEIVRTLNIFYGEDYFRIIGVLYFQRISDVRMSGSSIKSLRIFEKLCGAECFHKVIIVTTFWSLLQNDHQGNGVGEEREMALRTDPAFFGTLVNGGANMQRHMDTHQSATRIVDSLFKRPETVVLSVQKEMVNYGLTLDETAVGQFLIGDLSATRQKYERDLTRLREDYEEAIRVSEDDDIVVSMTEERDEIQERITQSQLAQETLHVSYEAMARKQQDLVSGLYLETLAQTEDSDGKTAGKLELEELLERAEQDHFREMNLLRRDNEAERRDTKAEVLRLKEALAYESAKRKKFQTKIKSQTFWQELFRKTTFQPFIFPQGPRRSDSAPIDFSNQPTIRRNKNTRWFDPGIRKTRKAVLGDSESGDEEGYSKVDDADGLESSSNVQSFYCQPVQYPEGTSIAERKEPITTGPVRKPAPFTLLQRSFTGQNY